jgi:leader peptidase (prepilin peptidase) / N-methyltransferase
LEIIFYITIALLGLIFGSFANVIIYRWPIGKSIVTPRSQCPNCQKNVAWFDNIPLLSFFILKGKCRHCSTKISNRYPLVEALMMISFVITAYVIGSPTWTLVEHLWLVFGLITVSFIDIDHFLLPDKFTLSGIAIGILGAFLNPDRSFFAALGGVLIGGGFLWLIAWLYWVLKKQEGMGGGDIKLLAWIGAVLGMKAVPFVIIVSSLIGTVVGLALMKKTGDGMKTVIPFGPYLAFGAVLYMWGGEIIGNWYLALFFPALF